jgi:regulator of replication initiation timing
VRGLKQMVEALLHDNQVLQQDNEDFKKAMQMTVEKYKETQVSD